MTQYRNRISTLPIILILLFITISCDTEDPFRIPPPDFTTVPEAYDITNIEPLDLREGVQAYIHEEGYGEFFVSPRDQVSVFLSMRTDAGDIIYSTFSSDRTNPVIITMSVAGDTQPSVFEYSIRLTYTPGLKIGLLGMKPGERRTIVVPPEQAFGNLREGQTNYQYRNNSIIYDIRISDIGPSKSR